MPFVIRTLVVLAARLLRSRRGRRALKTLINRVRDPRTRKRLQKVARRADTKQSRHRR